LPLWKQSSINGPSAMKLYGDYAQLLKSRCLDIEVRDTRAPAT
jgi:hypothetical protein